MEIDLGQAPKVAQQGLRVGARRGVLGGIVFGALSGIVSCSEAPVETLGSDSNRPHVVFALIDTLRADHVGAYGYARETSPFMDSLASNGVFFEDVVAQSSWTQPSVASILTSRYPKELGAEIPFSILPEEAITLAETFAEVGYATAAVVTNPHTAPELGIMQGFEHVDIDLKAPADWVVDRGIAQLSGHLEERPGDPLLLYLHFMDVHTPLTPPPPYQSMFMTDGEPGESAVARDRRKTLALYDGALRFVDDQLARMARELEKRGIGEETAFVVTSDHGEMFWEHIALERAMRLRKNEETLGTGHGYALFPELLRIPLAMKIPGLGARVVTKPVRGIDIAPTLLTAVGIDPPEVMEGVDLLAPVGVSDALPALSRTEGEEVPQVSLREAEWQYLRVREEEYLFRFFDPKLVDQAAIQSEELARLRVRLDQLDGSLEAHVPETYHIPPELIPMLEQLGYAGNVRESRESNGEGASEN